MSARTNIFCTFALRYTQIPEIQTMNNIYKRITLIIKSLLLYVLTIYAANDNIYCPWQKIFDECNLPEYAAQIPFQITNCDIFYQNGNMAGLWALTPPVAIKYGLKINDTVDERFDPKISAVAAARYLYDLTRFYKNDKLAILAYMNGPALVRDVAMANGLQLPDITDTTIVRLMELLPNKWNAGPIHSDRYRNMPANVSISILNDSVFNRNKGIAVTLDCNVRKNVLQDSLQMTARQFRILNPSVIGNTAWLPEGMEIYVTDTAHLTAKFYETEKYEYENAATIRMNEIAAINSERTKAIKAANAEIVYKVKSGDTLGQIAKRHKVTVRQIKQWNNLRSDMIRIGQKLKIRQQ